MNYASAIGEFLGTEAVSFLSSQAGLSADTADERTLSTAAVLVDSVEATLEDDAAADFIEGLPGVPASTRAFLLDVHESGEASSMVASLMPETAAGWGLAALAVATLAAAAYWAMDEDRELKSNVDDVRAQLDGDDNEWIPNWIESRLEANSTYNWLFGDDTEEDQRAREEASRVIADNRDAYLDADDPDDRASALDALNRSLAGGQVMGAAGASGVGAATAYTSLQSGAGSFTAYSSDPGDIASCALASEGNSEVGARNIIAAALHVFERAVTGVADELQAQGDSENAAKLRMKVEREGKREMTGAEALTSLLAFTRPARVEEDAAPSFGAAIPQSIAQRVVARLWSVEMQSIPAHDQTDLILGLVAIMSARSRYLSGVFAELCAHVGGVPVHPRAHVPMRDDARVHSTLTRLKRSSAGKAAISALRKHREGGHGPWANVGTSSEFRAAYNALTIQQLPNHVLFDI